ncbi:hypothetical protein [Prevotella sp. HUN102]|uniref:hypothetical protein n=1 Tax=Prevotella sp. HUN102 TaxID=1392486 RepID=UPI0018CC1652|nr:hypothetical protein [Prevotella sp. HUN102]
MRKRPSVNSPIVDKIQDGYFVNYTDLRTGWVKVYEYSKDGMAKVIGYMARNKIVDWPNVYAVPYLVEPEGGYTNIRKRPGGAVVSKVKDGSIILANPDDYFSRDWVRVYNQRGTLLGYIHCTKLLKLAEP